MPFTLIAFHAHPDDETLLTGGTLARAAADGHRVVLVTATAGEVGLAAERQDLGRRRGRELEAAAAALGCQRVVHMGYPDSGWPSPGAGAANRDGSRQRFADLDPRGPAERLAAILREERADVLTTYDVHGGYGHPDHVQVHRVGALAAELAGTPVLLEATVDRDSLRRLASVLRRVPRLKALVPDDGFAESFTPRAAITHRVDVRSSLGAKRAALRAHASQAGGGDAVRTIAALLRLPTPVLGLALGREWFVERGRTPAARPCDDVFATLRG